MINTLDQKVIGKVIQTPVESIRSLQICPLSTSEVNLIATGWNKSYSSNKSDILNVSKVCEKSVIERVFSNPTHHQNELKKQLAKFNKVNQTEKLKNQKNPTQMVPAEQEIHHFKKQLSEKEDHSKNQNVNEQVQKLLNQLHMKEGIIASLQDNNSQLKSQLESKNNQLIQSKRNENKLNSQVKKLINTITDKIKKIEQHQKITSSLELNLKNCRNENEKLLNDKNQLKKELSEITKKYVLLRKKPRSLLMIQKTLLVQSQRRNICNKCGRLPDPETETESENEEINEEEDIEELRFKNEELRTNLRYLRGENERMIIDKEDLKEKNRTVKKKCEKLMKQVETTSESIEYW
jgi:DNA repair exonuclease SbcCD ATPase subunit